eukprot:TRINITY_DN4782_c0_g1_i1.p1 TRINITY_DN4782_c0_g1~~TRINITY_DN4782_c0_g1_i1.p1  ORF type:complete len:283 (+),score=77.31 TRINITY_DN4782_c0_g1_i1:113-961(+)
MGFVWVWLLVAAVGLLAALLYSFQNYLLYYPSIGSDIVLHPRVVHLESVFSEWSVPTLDGQRLQAWLFAAHKNRPTLLFFISNAGNISHRLPHIAGLVFESKVNVFILSYRGYGKSTGKPTEAGLKIDAEAALAFLKTKEDLIDTNNIVVFGNSLGGAVAIYLAARHSSEITGLIVENTFTSIPDMIPAVFPIIAPFRNLSVNKWNSLVDIPKVHCPILFLSSGQDEMVPPPHMLRLYDAAPEPKHIHHFPLGHHMDLFELCKREYFLTIANWLDKTVVVPK